MKLLVISSNPLFTEVLNAALEGHNGYEVSIATPCEFSQVLAKVEPDVIIVDEGMGEAVYEPILTAAREKTSSHIILLNPKDNRLCVLDSHRTIIQEIDDLRQAISRQIVNASSNSLHVHGNQTCVEADASAVKEVKQQPEQS